MRRTQVLEGKQECSARTMPLDVLWLRALERLTAVSRCRLFIAVAVAVARERKSPVVGEMPRSPSRMPWRISRAMLLAWGSGGKARRFARLIGSAQTALFILLLRIYTPLTPFMCFLFKLHFSPCLVYLYNRDFYSFFLDFFGLNIHKILTSNIYVYCIQSKNNIVTINNIDIDNNINIDFLTNIKYLNLKLKYIN